MLNTRPVFSRLPVTGFQDNPVVDWVTDYYDSKLVSTGLELEQLHTKLKPATAPADYLDYIAALMGLSSKYYNTSWSTATKRAYLQRANFIFANKGTRKALDASLSIHGFEYTISTSADLMLPFTLPATFGDSSSNKVYIKLPIKYRRAGYEFSETSRALENYCSINTSVLTCYDKFYVGFSAVGDPLF